MTDRQSLHPGRVLLTNVNTGESELYDLTMADEPTDEGTPPTKEHLLTDETETLLFGDTADRDVNKSLAFVGTKLKLISGDQAIIDLTVVDQYGNPVKNVLVSGIVSADGKETYTDASGKISGFVAEGTVTLSVDGYTDVENYSESFEVLKGETLTKTITLTRSNFVKLTSSKNVKFSGDVTTIDYSLGAAGGGAAGGIQTTFYYVASGGAGGGGRVVTAFGVSVKANTLYKAVIGAGGTPAQKEQQDGGDGGNSTFMGSTAEGGKGGKKATGAKNTIPTGGVGGTGNGNGANGASGSGASTGTARPGNNGGVGTEKIFKSFTEEEDYGGGGATGGACKGEYGGTGGSPAGGKGGRAYRDQYNGSNGKDGFGGGGGSAGVSNDKNSTEGPPKTGASGKGGCGCLCIRIHFSFGDLAA